MTKQCIKCKEIKNLEDFEKGRNCCKVCRRLQVKEYKIKNKEKIKQKNKIYRQNNLEELLKREKEDRIKRKDYFKEYSMKNKEKINLYGRQHHAENKDEINKKKREYYSENKDKKRKYYLDNKEKIDEVKRNYKKKKKSTDINFKIRINLRCRFNRAIRGKYKAGSAIRDLGCSVEEFKTYMESKFQEGMTWNNWSKTGWHMDHIKPLASFDLTKRDEVLKACHYTNIQPLWATDNLKKGKK